MKDIVYALYDIAEEFGPLTVLARFGGGLRVRMPVCFELCRTPVDELDLSVRSKNGLMRAGAVRFRALWMR